METYSLREIIKNTALKHSGEITDAGLIFRVNVEEEVPDLYYGNYEHLADMLDYLISISILHTKEGKIVVCVGLEHANNDTEKVVLHIEVIDTGSGLSEDEKEQLLVFFDVTERVNIETEQDLGTNVSVLLSFRSVSIERAEEYIYRATPKPAKKSMISLKEGLQYTGSDMDIYLFTLNEYLKEWNAKKSDIEIKFEFGDWENYRILVHALKSASYTIGAKAFGDEAKALEFAAREGDSEFIFNNHMKLMDKLETVFEDAKEILASNNFEAEEES